MIRNTQTTMRVTEDEFKVRMRKSDYVCLDCGRPYLTEKQLQEENVSTFHVGECGLCGKTRSITHIRNYNYLRSKRTATIINNQSQGNSEEFTLTSDQKKEIKERAKQTMLLKDVGDVR